MTLQNIWIRARCKPSWKEAWVGFHVYHNRHGFLGVSSGPRREPVTETTITVNLIPFFPVSLIIVRRRQEKNIK